MDFALQYGFRLGELEVYPLRGEILKPGGSVHLQPKAMEVLVCLAERPMELVSRSELLNRVWGVTGPRNRHADDNLNRCISELRHELEDHATNPHFIQTVPRRGYRLVVPVQLLDGAADVAAGYDAYLDDRDPLPKSADRPTAAARPGGVKKGGRQANPSNWSVDRLLGEMQRRRVFRVAIGYPVIAWGFMEFGDFLVGRILTMPEHLQQLIMQLLFAFLAMGYALSLYLAWVTQLTPEGVKVEPDSSLPRFLTDGPRVWLAIAVGLVAVIGAGLWFFQNERGTATLADTECQGTIGVLPFDNSSPSQQDAYLGRELSEEVLHRLSHVAGLSVAPRPAAFSLNIDDLTVQEIGKRLGVCNILSGSVRREGESIRIAARLVNARTGFNSWTGTYDRQIEDIFDVYGDITSAVVRSLKVEFDDAAREMFASRPTKSIDAYDRYLQGRSILVRADDESRVLRADHMFERALEYDNDFVQAWAGRCDANVNLYEFTRASKWIATAEDYCGEALARDKTLTDVRVALARLLILAGRLDEATVQLNAAKAVEPDNAEIWRCFGMANVSQRNLGAAEKDYQRAISLAPSDLRLYQDLGTLYFDNGRLKDSEAVFRDMVTVSRGSSAAYTGLGSALLLQGRFAESSAAYRSAITNEPNPRTYSNAGTAYFYDGKFKEAAVLLREAVELSPDDYRLVGNLADAVTRLPGRSKEAADLYERAAELAEQAISVNSRDAYAASMIAHYYAELGRRESAEAAIRTAEILGPDQFYTYYFVGLAWLDLGRQDKALESLRKSIGLGYPKALLAADPHLVALRSEAEFGAAVGDGAADSTGS